MPGDLPGKQYGPSTVAGGGAEPKTSVSGALPAAVRVDDDLTTARFTVTGQGEVDVVVRRLVGDDLHRLTCSAGRGSAVPRHEVVEVRPTT